MSRKPKPSFIIRFVGAEIRPESVPLTKLADALRAVQRLLADEPTDELDLQDAEAVLAGASLISLLDIRRTSAAYRVFAHDGAHALQRLALVGAVVRHPARIAELPAGISAFEDLSAIAKTLGCIIEFRKLGDNNPVLATIEPTTFDQLAGEVFVKGETSLYGQVERVGGATRRHCGLRIPQQRHKQLVCQVDNIELARDLGKNLYQEIVVHGTATWFRFDWSIRSFVIRRWEPAPTTSLVAAFQLLRKAGGSAWDRVDRPESFLANTRH